VANRVRSVLVTLAVAMGSIGASISIVSCGGADVEEVDRGGEGDGGDEGDSYDPDEIDEREENE
jgi:hypothetical protein